MLYLLINQQQQITGMINYCHYSPTMSTLQVISKIQGMDVIQDFIKLVYDKKVSFFQISQFVKFLSFEVGYGTVYSLIRQNLQNVCKTHRILIFQSTKSIHLNHKLYYLITTNAVHQKDQEYNFIKEYETITMIIYYHYSSICESNKQICQLWEQMKQKQSFIKTQNENIRTPELKLSTLNLLTLKELIPNSDYINLTNLQAILERLIKSNLIQQNKKNQMKEMLNTLNHKQLNFSKLFDKVNLIKPQQKLIQPISWLQKIKNQPIGKKFSQILDQKFAKIGNQQQIFDQKTKIQLSKGLLPQKLFTLGASFSSIKFRVTTLSQTLENPQKQPRENQIQVIEFSMNTNQQNVQKKKKKKNKKKKNKSISSQQQQTKIGSKDNKIVQKQKVKIDKNCQEIINFLREMRIDDKKRTSCIELSKLERWKNIQLKIANN